MTERWLVYGRTDYADPLSERGALEGEPPGDVAEAVRARFPGPWIELVAYPERAAQWIVSGGEERW